MSEKKSAQKEKPVVTSLKTITKTNVWELSESEVVTLLENASRDIDIETQLTKLEAVIKTAFDVEEVKNEPPASIAALEKRGYFINKIRITPTKEFHWALKKKVIARVTDLTYENIHHVTAPQLLELIDKNFGGGWESLALSIKDIILTGFQIATTSMPKSRVVTKSGLYGKKISEGFDVLELEKGTWVDLIFAKVKEEQPTRRREEEEEEKHHHRRSFSDEFGDDNDNDDYENEDSYESDDFQNDDYDDEDDYDEEKLTEESYLTVTDEDPETLDIADVEDDEDY